jgi:hypothetical protein
VSVTSSHSCVMFSDRGLRALKGVPEDWQLYAGQA